MNCIDDDFLYDYEETEKRRCEDYVNDDSCMQIEYKCDLCAHYLIDL